MDRVQPYGAHAGLQVHQALLGVLRGVEVALVPQDCCGYLLDNPLLTEPLRPEHIKPRLLGHWGTSPGLNFIWAHLYRAIMTHDQSMIFVIGPGHGGPAALANSWLEGSYTEVYPSVPRDAGGMRELFRQFSLPGGVPSHVAPQTRKGRPRQAPGVRPSRAARDGSVTSPHLRDEGTRCQNTRYRRPPRTCGDHGGGISRQSLQICAEFYPLLERLPEQDGDGMPTRRSPGPASSTVPRPPPRR